MSIFYVQEWERYYHMEEIYGKLYVNDAELFEQ